MHACIGLGVLYRSSSRHLWLRLSHSSKAIRRISLSGWTWRRYRDTGTLDELSRSGRPRATTAMNDFYLRISARRNLDSNATMLNNAFRATTGRRIRTQTVRNRLLNAQLHSRLQWQGPSFQPRHHAAWYRWAQQHAEWTPRNWHHVLLEKRSSSWTTTLALIVHM